MGTSRVSNRGDHKFKGKISKGDLELQLLQITISSPMGEVRFNNRIITMEVAGSRDRVDNNTIDNNIEFKDLF